MSSVRSVTHVPGCTLIGASALGGGARRAQRDANLDLHCARTLAGGPLGLDRACGNSVRPCHRRDGLCHHGCRRGTIFLGAAARALPSHFRRAVRERPWIGELTVTQLLPFAVAPVAISLLGGTKNFWLAVIVVNLAAFLLLALACHGALYRRRPEPARLTEFYLWVSFGGVLGGIFAGLIAPNIFSGTYDTRSSLRRR